IIRILQNNGAFVAEKDLAAETCQKLHEIIKRVYKAIFRDHTACRSVIEKWDAFSFIMGQGMKKLLRLLSW
ncbi:hypothetical protein LH384_34425, partial [Pseudomonas aeruginosa]|nr:hypothetical protein [Pseudomonas aeruginosa]